MIMLNTNKISEIGNYISEQMRELKINDSILNINVDVESFKKIDEDLFYRMNENNKEKEIIPSEKEIIISFPNVKLIINEKG
jgi:hypothetical protein